MALSEPLVTSNLCDSKWRDDLRIVQDRRRNLREFLFTHSAVVNNITAITE